MAIEPPCFLYRLRGADGALLYVGITRNVALRLGQHGAVQSWWSDVADVEVEVHTTRAEALAAEARAIRSEAPRHNVLHTDRPRAVRTPTPRPVEGPTWTVEAVRWRLGWELHIEGVGVTQSPSFARAERMVRDYLATDQGLTDEQADRLRIEIEIRLPEEQAAEIRRVKAMIAEAAEATRALAAAQRETVRLLSEDGLSGVDIAFILGVSKQRVSQLLATP